MLTTLYVYMYIRTSISVRVSYNIDLYSNRSLSALRMALYILRTGIEPAILLAHPDEEFDYSGRRLSLPCLAFGSPPPVISWNSSVLGDESVNIYSEEFEDINGTLLVLSTLELCNSTPSDFSEYTCTATNAIEDQVIGTTSATFDLIPQGDYATHTIMIHGVVCIHTYTIPAQSAYLVIAYSSACVWSYYSMTLYGAINLWA